MDIHKRALAWRVLNHLTQEEMAQRMGMSRQAYSSFEAGHSQLRPTNAKRLAALLDAPEDGPKLAMLALGEKEQLPATVQEEPVDDFSTIVTFRFCGHCRQLTTNTLQGQSFHFCGRCGKPFDARKP